MITSGSAKLSWKWMMVILLMVAYEISHGATTNRVAEVQAPQEYSGRSPRGWELPRMAIDPTEEHIYGVSFEARGTPGCQVVVDHYRTLLADGSELASDGLGSLPKYGVYLEVNDQWQPGHAEMMTKRNSAWLVITLGARGTGEVSIRNVRLVEGGFPDKPPLAGVPYLRWINSLQPNRAWAGAYPLKRFSNPPGDVIKWKAETEAFRELPVERLIELMPVRAPLIINYSFQDARKKYRWDPRHPDVLMNPDGTVFEIEKTYPLGGYQEVVAPSGKIVKYPYYDPPGTVLPVTNIEGTIQLPGECMVFGPIWREEAVLSQAQLVSAPQEITIGNRKLKGQRAKISGNKLDLGALMGGKEEGKTAYVFMEITAAEGQTVTLGAGADWWMQWWLNGQPVYDTTQSGQGNKKWPPSITDHCFNVSLKKGANILAGRVISGSGSFMLALGGTDDLRRTMQSGKRKLSEPVPGRVYLDNFMTSARIAEMMYAARQLAAIYRNGKDHDAALRAAAILWALSRNIPDWPVYGGDKNNYQNRQFWRPDTYEQSQACIAGSWHFPAMGIFIPSAEIYDALREAPVWDELSKICGRPDPRLDIENGLLHVVKMSLKMDAYSRIDPYTFYHNTLGTQLSSYIMIGRAIGCPELVHYAVNKGTFAFSYAFMVDGMFPESASYIHDMVGGLCNALEGPMDGYADPGDYVAAVDGRRIESFQLEKEEPFIKRFKGVMDRLYFPDGSMLTVHDSWANTQHSFRGGIVRERVEPYLIPEFGHAILGNGTKPDWFESHLHYSGCYNHHHQDMLTFTLWAYGDELTADMGYSHIGRYEVSTLAHNLVVVDDKVQRENNLHMGDLIAWYPNHDACQAAQAADTNVYPQTQRYRRAIINVPFGPGKDAVVDIFETRGGRRHEWMANGCADYEQTVETTLSDPVKKLPNLAPDGQPLIINIKADIYAAVPNDSFSKTSSYYGAFSEASVYRNDKPWNLTMKAGPPVPPGTPGAGPRAVTNAVKPGLRLHWLAPLDGEAILCKAPRQRYYHENYHEVKIEEEARKAWGKNLMPKVIVRRDAGKDMPLESTFVAVWEPFRTAPWLEEASKLQVDESAGIGVRLAGAGNEAIILYRKPEYEGTLNVKVSPVKEPGMWNRLMKSLGYEKQEEFAGNGRFTILRRSGEQAQASPKAPRSEASERVPRLVMIDLYDGSLAQFGQLTARLKPIPPMKLLAIEQAGEENSLVVEGVIPSYPQDATNQPHAGQYIKFCQPGQVARWLPLARVEKKEEGKSRLVLAREPGFVYDLKWNILRETYFPFRTLSGPTNQEAVVQFPNWLNLKWERGEKEQKMAVNASGDVVLEYGQERIELSSQRLGKEWNNVILRKR